MLQPIPRTRLTPRSLQIHIRRPKLSNIGRLATDPDNSHPASFPYALVVYILLIIGLSAAVWGMFLASKWVAIAGFVITTVASVLLGLSHYDE